MIKLLSVKKARSLICGAMGFLCLGNLFAQSDEDLFGSDDDLFFGDDDGIIEFFHCFTPF